MSGMAVASKRYAKALYEVAKENDAIEETQSQLSAIAKAIADNPEVQSFFEHPNIAVSEKVRVVKAVVGDKVPAFVLNALQLLIERGRASAVSTVLDAYIAIVDEALGRSNAVVTSAFELTEEQKNEIAQKFSALTGKKITVDAAVDPSLLGGVRIRIGDTLYDGSLATKLAELERSFNKAR